MLATHDRGAAPLQGLSTGTATLVGLVSLGALAFARVEGWPLWATGTAAVVPWIPVFARDLARIYRRYGWLALFYGLVVTQGGHCLEHVAQMLQLHLLGLQGADARGIFGALDIESVHFAWNSWVILAILVLLARYPANRWLWLAALLAGWHEIEHAWIFSVYVATGLAGTPGLLAQGGVLGGGLPLPRPDLHFLYNLVESAPLFVAFFAQVRQAERPIRGTARPR